MSQPETPFDLEAAAIKRRMEQASEARAAKEAAAPRPSATIVLFMVKAPAVSVVLFMAATAIAFAAPPDQMPSIGTTKPVAILALPFTRLIPNSAPPAPCDAAHDNAIASTHTHRLCVCVDQRWTDSVYGTACAW
jgi:hypothetical protein